MDGQHENINLLSTIILIHSSRAPPCPISEATAEPNEIVAMAVLNVRTGIRQLGEFEAFWKMRPGT